MKSFFSKLNKKEIPWTGIALVVLSISITILSIRLTALSVQFKQLKNLQIENVKSDKMTTDNFTSIAKLHRTIYERIECIEKNSPANCLKEHLNLYKEISNNLIMTKKLLDRVEALEKSRLKK